MATMLVVAARGRGPAGLTLACAALTTALTLLSDVRLELVVRVGRCGMVGWKIQKLKNNPVNIY
jgi:hypothetical protein